MVRTPYGICCAAGLGNFKLENQIILSCWEKIEKGALSTGEVPKAANFLKKLKL